MIGGNSHASNQRLPFQVAKAQPLPRDHKHILKHAMNPTPPAPIHPRRYFEASPTFYHWNKVTCLDVHALRTEPGFAGQHIYFHLNHPIQFVRVVGLLVEIESVAEGRYTLLTIDDGSGACLVVKVKRRQVAKGDEAEWPSNTEVDNVEVVMHMGWPSLQLDGKRIAIGDVLKVKGTIDSFRDERQLELKRLFLIPDTNAEAQSWIETAKWKRDVLSKPWMLTPEGRDKVDAQIKREGQKERDHARRKKEWSRKTDEKRRRHDEKAEVKREKMAALYDAGALKGSGVIVAPWE